MTKPRKPRRKGNGRPVRLPNEFNVSVTPQIDAGVDAACAYLGMAKSQYAREAIMVRLINEGFIARPTPAAPNVEKAA